MATTAPDRARVSLRRILPFAAAATYLWMVAVLAIWVIGPTVGFGWTPILVDAGSMEPTVRAGDVVLVAESTDRAYLPGEVITYADPVWEGELVTHRIVATLPDDHYRTRGDASAVNDSTPIPHTDVLGSGRLLIPKIGLPVVWLAQAPVLLAFWVLLTLTAWVVVLRIQSFGEGATEGTYPSSRARRQSSRLDRLLRPRPVAGAVRRWAPVSIASAAVVPLAASLGPAALLWPVAILVLDPRGPQVRIGWLANRWRGGQVTRHLHPAPMTSALVVVLTVAMTLVSTATFTAASPNPTNTFALDVIDPATNLTATQTCAGADPDITLDWTPSPNPRATGYEIVRNGTPLITVVPESSSSFTDTTAANNTAYVYEVNAYATSWNSTQATVSITTTCYDGPHITGVVPADGNADYTLTVPSSVLAGDFVLAFIGNDENASIAPPAGWNLGRSRYDGDDSFAVYYWRIAGAGEAGTSYVFNGIAGSTGAGMLIAYRGVDTLDPIVEDADEAWKDSTQMTLKEVDVTQVGQKVIGLWLHDRATTATPPSPMQTRLLGDAFNQTLLIAEQTPATIGKTAQGFATPVIQGDGASLTILLRPAPGGFAALRVVSDPSAALPISPLASFITDTGTGTGTGVVGSNGRLALGQLIDIGHGHRLQPAAAAAYASLWDAASRELGIDLSARISDSYRTFEQQVSVAALKGLYSQGGLAAEPGTSNHGLGLALDIDTSGGLGTWLAVRAPAFGFHTIPREPWHWEFRGTSR